jgi:hypothetical protein
LVAFNATLEQVSPGFKGFETQHAAISLRRWCFDPLNEVVVSKKETRVAKWLTTLVRLEIERIKNKKKEITRKANSGSCSEFQQAKARLQNKSLALDSSLMDELRSVENDPFKVRYSFVLLWLVKRTNSS